MRFPCHSNRKFWRNRKFMCLRVNLNKRFSVFVSFLLPLSVITSICVYMFVCDCAYRKTESYTVFLYCIRNLPSSLWCNTQPFLLHFFLFLVGFFFAILGDDASWKMDINGKRSKKKQKRQERNEFECAVGTRSQ